MSPASSVGVLRGLSCTSFRPPWRIAMYPAASSSSSDSSSMTSGEDVDTVARRPVLATGAEEPAGGGVDVGVLPLPLPFPPLPLPFLPLNIPRCAWVVFLGHCGSLAQWPI